MSERTLRRNVGALTAAILAAASLAFGVAADDTAYIGKLPALAAAPDKHFDEFYAKPGLSLAGFKGLYIAPVRLLEGRDEALKDLVPEDTDQLVGELLKELKDKLGGLYPLADGPADDVLVLEIALTSLVANQPDLTLSHREAGRRTIVQIGGAAMQGVLKDGGSGEALAAFVDRKSGDPLESNLNLISVWGDAYDSFRDWAHSLARKLASLKDAGD